VIQLKLEGPGAALWDAPDSEGVADAHFKVHDATTRVGAQVKNKNGAPVAGRQDVGPGRSQKPITSRQVDPGRTTSIGFLSAFERQSVDPNASIGGVRGSVRVYIGVQGVVVSLPIRRV